ncbi:DUF4179 domain-containing protein [Clostridium hydrogenum]|uniref:DUF4179 domain-containing protein n=1 Tax=Clostridium hydrogenum TaxID=2855764 RepID=UPI001F31BFAD|nr:DUF4179 domain-containing protein [Clostridium hydrogenum]
MNTNIPDDLMDNVERRLRKHVKDKSKKKHVYRAAAVIIGFLVILPVSAFAYTQYNDSILYKQSIDLAIENNDFTKVNKVFKYKNVTFSIKDIVADTTGIEVIYDVSDPNYSVNKIGFGDKDNKKFDESNYMYPDSQLTTKEKSFFIGLNTTQANYVKNNLVSIDIESIAANNSKASQSITDRVKKLIYGQNKTAQVDWTLKTRVPMKETKIIQVNKEYDIDIGTLKINSLRVGLFSSMFDYSFVPKDKNIAMINPMFAIRLDKEYVNSFYGDNYSPGGGMVTLDEEMENIKSGDGKVEGFFGTRGFKSLYYKKTNQIGIKLVAMNVLYNSNDSKVYKIEKNNLPMEFNYNGEKFKIASVKENKDSTEYNLEYEKNNRKYNQIIIGFLEKSVSGAGYSEEYKSGKVRFEDQASRDKLYASIIKKVPNLNDIEKSDIDFTDGETNVFQDATISEKIILNHKGTSSEPQFKIQSALKNLIYDEDEIVINNPFKNN